MKHRGLLKVTSVHPKFQLNANPWQRFKMFTNGGANIGHLVLLAPEGKPKEKNRTLVAFKKRSITGVSLLRSFP